MNWYPRGFGGDRTDPEIIKREGWRGMGTLVVRSDDPRLTWPEKELIRQIGEKLYGQRKIDGDAHD